MPLRKLSSLDISQVIPANIVQEQGVSGFERFTVKNFATNPRAARKFLEAQGYEVRPYGKGINFAVRRAPEDPWQVVDPKGFDAGDIFDLMTDLIQGGVVGAATVAGGAATGGLGAAGAGAAAGLGSEGLRQGIGSLLGIPDNFSGASLALQGGAGAVTPALGKAASMSLRGLSKALPSAGNLSAEVGSRIAGFGASGPGLSAVRGLKEASRLLKIAKEESRQGLRSIGVTAKDVRKIVNETNDSLFPETTILRSGLAELDRPVHLSRALRKMERIANIDFNKAVTTGQNRTTVREIQKAMAGGETDFIKNVRVELAALKNFMRGELGIEPTRKITLLQANAVRKHLQDRAADAGVFKFRAGGPHKDATQRFLGEMQKNVSSLIKDMTDDIPFRAWELETGREVRLTARQLLDKISTKTTAMNNLREALGLPGRKTTDISKAEEFIKSVFGTDEGAKLDLLQNFDNLFGTNMGSRALEANLASVFGEGGVPKLLPRFTAFGTFIGPSLIGAGGFLAGGPLGALAGGLAASPKSIVAMTQLAQNYGPKFLHALGRGADAKIGGRTFSLANYLMASTERSARAYGGKSVSREDPRRPRPTVLTGY